MHIIRAYVDSSNGIYGFEAFCLLLKARLLQSYYEPKGA